VTLDELKKQFNVGDEFIKKYNENSDTVLDAKELKKFLDVLSNPKVVAMGFKKEDFFAAKGFIDISKYDEKKAVMAAGKNGLAISGSIKLADIQTWLSKNTLAADVLKDFLGDTGLKSDSLTEEQFAWFLFRLHKQQTGQVNVDQFETDPQAYDKMIAALLGKELPADVAAGVTPPAGTPGAGSEAVTQPPTPTPGPVAGPDATGTPPPDPTLPGGEMPSKVSPRTRPITPDHRIKRVGSSVPETIPPSANVALKPEMVAGWKPEDYTFAYSDGIDMPAEQGGGPQIPVLKVIKAVKGSVIEMSSMPQPEKAAIDASQLKSKVKIEGQVYYQIDQPNGAKEEWYVPEEFITAVSRNNPGVVPGIPKGKGKKGDMKAGGIAPQNDPAGKSWLSAANPLYYLASLFTPSPAKASPVQTPNVVGVKGKKAEGHGPAVGLNAPVVEQPQPTLVAEPKPEPAKTAEEELILVNVEGPIPKTPRAPGQPLRIQLGKALAGGDYVLWSKTTDGAIADIPKAGMINVGDAPEGDLEVRKKL
jgi:hypothetical protein